MALPGIPIPETQCIGDSLDTINNSFTSLDTAVAAAAAAAAAAQTAANNAAAGGVTKITAGTNISISPTGGTGDVTINAEGGATVTVQDTPPGGAQPGDLWFDSSSGVTSVYYDGTWVDVGGGDSGTSAGSVNGIVKADGAGNFSAAVAGTDYLTSASSGSVKAWVNFNGTNGTINSDFNILSVTRTALGIYTVTIDNDMSNTDYVVLASAAPDATGLGFMSIDNLAVGSFRIRSTTTYASNGSSAYNDPPAIFCAIFGN